MEETAVAVTAAVSLDFADTLKHWCELMLVWIGFGTVTGLAAKALMPGRDPGGSIATLVMGIGGTLIGCGLLAFFKKDMEVTPISMGGFALGTTGAFVLLFFYRFLGGVLVCGRGPGTGQWSVGQSASLAAPITLLQFAHGIGANRQRNNGKTKLNRGPTKSLKFVSHFAMLLETRNVVPGIQAGQNKLDA